MRYLDLRHQPYKRRVRIVRGRARKRCTVYPQSGNDWRAHGFKKNEHEDRPRRLALCWVAPWTIEVVDQSSHIVYLGETVKASNREARTSGVRHSDL